MVMGVDSRSKGRGFESQPRYWMDMTFFTFICCKNCIVCLKRPKINKKEAGVGPIFLRMFVVKKQPSLVGETLNGTPFMYVALLYSLF